VLIEFYNPLVLPDQVPEDRERLGEAVGAHARKVGHPDHSDGIANPKRRTRYVPSRYSPHA
jgi:hypothetical protein